MKGTRITLLLLTLAVSSCFLLGAWQGHRYSALTAEVSGLEAEQNRRMEENKKLIAALALLASPQRIDRLAREELGLKRPGAAHILKVLLDQHREEGR